MAGNTFGTLFSLTTFGESHGPAIGGIIDGCPAGLYIDTTFVQSELDRRRPGSTSLGTSRHEEDTVEFLSGIFERKSTGTPIGFIIRNNNARSGDYDVVKTTFRPSHADFTYSEKYGIRDYRGGGRSSARETACRVVAGAVAKLLLAHHGICVNAYVASVGDIQLKKTYHELDLHETYRNEVRCPDKHMASFMSSLIEKVRKEGDSIGGTVCGVAQGVPPGLGEPVFNKLNSALAGALMGINAVKGFEFGSGFEGSQMRGSEHNDQMAMKDGKPVFLSNHSGGIQGGISTGQDIYFRLAFKPVASISKEQKTVDSSGKDVELALQGRHDPCVLPRAVAVVEAMTALVLADFLLFSRLNKLN